jgi:hypothetical protein
VLLSITEWERFATGTECPLCWRAEATRTARVKAWAFDWLDSLGKPPPLPIGLGAGYGNLIRAFTGRSLPKPPTWYDRHRELYVESGDPVELVRMERHVGETDG